MLKFVRSIKNSTDQVQQQQQQQQQTDESSSTESINNNQNSVCGELSGELRVRDDSDEFNSCSPPPPLPPIGVVVLLNNNIQDDNQILQTNSIDLFDIEKNNK